MAVAEIDGEYSRPEPEDVADVKKTLSPALQRITRQRALELAVEVAKAQPGGNSILQLANRFENYILNGSEDNNGGR